ncbi:agmatinase [Elusimicrobiota bacterium]
MKINYGNIPDEYSYLENSKIVIIPIPYGKTSSWIKGADKGPTAILEASANMELYDIETDSEVYIKGIHTDAPIIAYNAEELIKASRASVLLHINDGKFIVTIGGEHTVSIGPAMAHSEAYPDLTILHLDAHSDRRESYDNDSYSHACTMARIEDFTRKTVSVGIRSMDSSEKDSINSKRIIYAQEIYNSDKWIDRTCDLLTDDVYVTIDLDVLDPSIMPSTGTPEPGGLSWYQILSLFKKIAAERNIVGFDVVELCPTDNKAPDFLAAKLIYKLLSYINQ